MTAHRRYTVVYKDAEGLWRWRFVSHKILADSGQGYRNRTDCLKALRTVCGDVEVRYG